MSRAFVGGEGEQLSPTRMLEARLGGCEEVGRSLT